MYYAGDWSSKYLVEKTWNRVLIVIKCVYKDYISFQIFYFKKLAFNFNCAVYFLPVVDKL